jgi:hypothetical protein
MKNGKGKHLTVLHMYTDYKITEKSVSDMTMLQYNAILIIANNIQKFKGKKKPVVVI